MANKPEEIVAKLRQVEVLTGQEISRLQKESERLRRAVPNLILDKLIKAGV